MKQTTSLGVLVAVAATGLSGCGLVPSAGEAMQAQVSGAADEQVANAAEALQDFDRDAVEALGCESNDGVLTPDSWEDIGRVLDLPVTVEKGEIEQIGWEEVLLFRELDPDGVFYAADLTIPAEQARLQEDWVYRAVVRTEGVDACLYELGPSLDDDRR